MNLFGFEIARKKPQDLTSATPSRPQVRDSSLSPFASAFASYAPLKHNIGLFRVLREAIPFINVAILKRTKLIGSFGFETFGDEGLKKKLDDFKRNVPVNWPIQRGLDVFLDAKINSTFETGMGFGEIVPTQSLNSVHYLKTCRTEDIRFVQDEVTGAWQYAARREQSLLVEPLPNQDLITYLSFDNRDAHPRGYSILYSLPFVAQVLIRMEKSWENMAFRFGDPTIAMIVKGGKGDKTADVKGIVEGVTGQWKKINILRKQGQAGDMIGGVGEGGDVEFKVIGEGAQITISEISVRTILEQIIANLDLPPFMLGISWSSTERISKDQNDMIVTNVNHERDRISHVLDQIIGKFLIYERDFGKKWEVKWNEVNLMDEESQAKARMWNAQANLKIIESMAQMIQYGWISQQDGEEYLRREGIEIKKFPKDWYQTTKGIRFVKSIAAEISRA